MRSIEGVPDGYQMFLWREPSKELLKNVINGANVEAREEAFALTHRLGSLGYLEYSDLLPGD